MSRPSLLVALILAAGHAAAQAPAPAHDLSFTFRTRQPIVQVSVNGASPVPFVVDTGATIRGPARRADPEAVHRAVQLQRGDDVAVRSVHVQTAEGRHHDPVRTGRGPADRPRHAGRREGTDGRAADGGHRCGRDVELNRPFVDAHRLLDIMPDAKGEDRPAALGGTAPFLYGTARRIVLGGVTFDRPRIGLSRATSGSSAGSTRDGILGNDLLSGFVMDVDYRHNRLVLTRPVASID